MKRTEKTFADERLKVLWIGFQDKESKIKDCIAAHGINKCVGYDNGDIISKKYGIKYGAGLVIINSNGIVKDRIPRGFSEKKLHENLNAILKNGKIGDKNQGFENGKFNSQY